jgi:hypothetical protein
VNATQKIINGAVVAVGTALAIITWPLSMPLYVALVAFALRSREMIK